MEEREVLNRMDRLEQVYREQLTQVFSAESVVPDTMADVASILLADAQVCIRSGSLSEGSAVLEGTVIGTVVYLPEGEEAPQKLSLTIPVTLTAKNDAIAADCRLVFRADSNGAEARALNSRKISFRTEICADVTVCRPGCIDLSADKGEITSLEILPGEIDLGFLLDIGEKTFTAADDIDLSAPIEQLLWYQTTLYTEGAKKAGSRIILQGGAELQLMYLQPDSAEPCFESFRIPFSQLVEAPDGESVPAAVDLRTISCFVDILPGLNRSDSVSVELQVAAQLLYTGEKKLSYISDAYSLAGPVVLTRSTLDAPGPYSPSARKTTVKETIKVPEQPREILSVQLHAAPCTVSADGIKTTVCVWVIYRTENALRSVMKKLPVTFDGDLSDMEYLYSSAVCTGVFSSVFEDSVQVQFDVELLNVCAKHSSVEYVSCMESDSSALTCDREYPSVVAVRPGDRSLWELAKTYHSTVALIEAANGGSMENEGFLLIPRGR